MAAKVAADLKRMQRLYSEPTDLWIEKYEAEIIALLKAGYLATVTYGFWRNESWIEPSLRYSARELQGGTANDDDPGRILPGANVQGASFYSYLTYSAAWDALTYTQRDSFKKSLPFYRGGAPEPAVSGYLVDDRTYSAGGRALGRSSVKSY
jgi:hypothetical protein